jgi:hypothetical protein
MSRLIVLLVSALVLFGSSPARAAETIDMYVDTQEGLQYFDTFTTDSAAANAADRKRLNGIAVLCKYSSNPDTFAICPTQFSSLSHSSLPVIVAGGAGHDVEIRQRRRRSVVLPRTA